MYVVYVNVIRTVRLLYYWRSSFTGLGLCVSYDPKAVSVQNMFSSGHFFGF